MLCYGCLYIISVSLNYVLFFQFVSCNEEKVFFLFNFYTFYIFDGVGEKKKDIDGDSCKKRLIIFLFVFLLRSFMILLGYNWNFVYWTQFRSYKFIFLMIQNKRKGILLCFPVK